VIGLKQPAAVVDPAGLKSGKHLLHRLRWHVWIEAPEDGEHPRWDLVQTLKGVGTTSTENPVLQTSGVATNSRLHALIQGCAQG
jgi:hypothetical protein